MNAGFREIQKSLQEYKQFWGSLLTHIDRSVQIRTRLFPSFPVYSNVFTCFVVPH